MAVSVPHPGSPSVGGVRSETGPLRQVLVHRPGRELDRLTPGNAAGLLFDEAPCPDLARSEHDELVAGLRSADVEVLYLADLLAGVMRVDTARAAAIEAACCGHGEPTRERVAAWLAELDAERLAEVLIAGATFAEANTGPPWIDDPEPAGAGPGLAVEPLPNQMFVRDSSARLGSHFVLGASSNPVRAREAWALKEIYERHPVFGQLPGGGEPIIAPEVEGGDLTCLGESAVLIGIGSRTSCDGAEALAVELFRRGFERVLAVEIPRERSCIHLDCLMTLVDADLLLADRRLLQAPVIEMLPPDGPVASRLIRSLPEALASALEIDEMRVVEVADEEQWTLAANTLALAPGRVIAFRSNVRTNEALAELGVEVLPVPGEALSRGHGGPRCLTCPLIRDQPAPAEAR